MGAIEPTADQIRELAGSRDAGPIVMLNLLRFKHDGGREEYERYGVGVAPHLARVGGRVLSIAEAKQTVIGPAEENWDLVILVEYPSRQAFLEMVADAGYQQVHEHRAAAVADSRLVCCVTPEG